MTRKGKTTSSSKTDEPMPLAVVLQAPFVGLTAEGEAPDECPTFMVGNFDIEVGLLASDGVPPYSARLRNYYGGFDDVEVEAGEDVEFH